MAGGRRKRLDPERALRRGRHHGELPGLATNRTTGIASRNCGSLPKNPRRPCRCSTGRRPLRSRDRLAGTPVQRAPDARRSPRCRGCHYIVAAWKPPSPATARQVASLRLILKAAKRCFHQFSLQRKPPRRSRRRRAFHSPWTDPRETPRETAPWHAKRAATRRTSGR